MAWFLAGLVQVGLFIGSAILSAVLNRNAGRETPPGEPTFPKADPAAPIPVVFGTTRVGINVIHKARVTRGENTIRNGALSFGWSSTKIGDFLYMDAAAVICHGGVGAVHEIYVDGTKKLSTAPSARIPLLDVLGITYTTAAVVSPSLPTITNADAVLYTITAGEILGGKLDRGGIGAGGDTGSTGHMRFYPGNGYNVANAQLETLHGAGLPHYPNLCWVAFEDNFYFGNSPQLPGIEFVVTRAPSAPFLGTGLLTNVSPVSGAPASAAGVVWEILTNTTWGLGLPASALDQTSFSVLNAACDAGLGEDGGLLLGLSFAVTTQVSAKQLLSDVLRTLDAVLYTDPETGLLNVRLLQPGTSVFALDESVISSVEWTESAPDAQANEIKVEFVDRLRDYAKNTVTVRNVAAIQQLGRVESRTVSFIGVQEADVATRLGMRELRAISTTLGHATIECDRTGYRLTPGQIFTLGWDVAGKSLRIMRCLSQRDTPNGGCVIEAVEDIYSTPAIAYAVENTPEPTPVGGTPTLTPYGYLESTITGTTTGNTTLFLYDPSSAVTLVEYRTRSGAAAYSGWTADTYPYTASVTLDAVADSVIEWRVTYDDAAGNSQTLTFTHTFSVDTDAAQVIADGVVALGNTLGQIGVPVQFVNVTEDDQWLALSTIPTAETEVGTEYRQQSYAVGVGSVRIGANIKAKTGTPTIGAKYTTNNFGATTALTSFTPSSTGVQYSAWAAMPSGAKADIGVTWTVGAGADTAALDLYRVWLEYLPTTVSGARVHTAAHTAAFN